MNPGLHALLYVFGVGMDFDVRRRVGFQRGKPRDNRSKLHTVIRRIGFATMQCFFMAAIAHQHTPAARARIAAAGAIGIDVNGV